VKRGVEAESGRKLRLLLEPRALLLGIGGERRKLVAGNPSPAALDAFAADDPAVRSGLLIYEVRPWLTAMEHD